MNEPHDAPPASKVASPKNPTVSSEAAIDRVIDLICQSLAWDWGSYWQVDDTDPEVKLVCRRHGSPRPPYDRLFTASEGVAPGPGQGLLGRVLQTGEAEWSEALDRDLDLPRAHVALELGLRSGYAFPVRSSNPATPPRVIGVLEFLSGEARQADAQLPGISAAIARLIAQSVQRQEQEAQIQQLSQQDALTGLANRPHFEQALASACEQADQQGITLLYVGIDRFKPINDAFGHDAGDTVLTTLAQRLQTLLPQEALAARLGGDEFALLLMDAHRARTTDLAENVRIAARTPIQLGTHTLRLTASLGVSSTNDSTTSGPALLREAETAMYHGKRTGGDACCWYHEIDPPAPESQQAPLLRRMHMATELRDALVKPTFELHYQPIIETTSNRMLRLEALIRWRHPSGELLLPADFLPVAEQAGLMPQLGRWVMRQACRDLGWLKRHGYPALRMHINLAASEVLGERLPLELAAIAKATGVNPRALALEFADTLLTQHPETALATFGQLRRLGCDIFMSGIGLGHTPLVQLKTLPISGFKLDAELMQGIPTERDDRALVQTLLDLGQRLRLTVIAQHVENDSQLGFLLQFGCPLVQGHSLGTPQPLSHYLDAVAAPAPPPE